MLLKVKLVTLAYDSFNKVIKLSFLHAHGDHPILTIYQTHYDTSADCLSGHVFVPSKDAVDSSQEIQSAALEYIIQLPFLKKKTMLQHYIAHL